jgi:hypothetical protein
MTYCSIRPDDLGPVGPLEVAREYLGDRRQREVLGLDVDVLAGGLEDGGVEGLDLAHLRLLAVGGLGAGQGDGAIRERRRDRRRPEIGFACHRGEHLAAGEAPALGGDGGDGDGRIAVDHHLDVMDRRIGLAEGINARRLVGRVVDVVPAALGQVHAADERQRAVDADDLLMVGRAQRMVVVELEMDARMVAPFGAERKRNRVAAIEDRVAPDEDVNLQIRARVDQAAEEPPERDDRVAVGPVGGQIGAERGAPVEIPAKNDDPPLRLGQGFDQGFEIGLSVDQEGHAAKAAYQPAVAPRAQHGVRVVAGARHGVESSMDMAHV